MYKENGFSYQILILVIIIIIAIAGVCINKVVGKNGVINRVASVENNYNREEILDTLNYKVMQKFIELNNAAKENHGNIAEMYNSDVVVEFLKQNFWIEETYDENGNVQEGIYLINVENLKEEDEGKYEGKFQLEKREEKYFVVYYDGKNESQDIGELQIQQT